MWAGRILSGLAVAFLLFDAVTKVLAIAPVVEASAKLGVADVRPIGVTLLIATLLLAVPRTAVIGALFVTAYLGGAVATMVNAGQPFYFPVVLGALVWIALVLRRPQLLEVL
jgi:hypothetical protein